MSFSAASNATPPASGAAQSVIGLPFQFSAFDENGFQRRIQINPGIWKECLALLLQAVDRELKKDDALVSPTAQQTEIQKLLNQCKGCLTTLCNPAEPFSLEVIALLFQSICQTAWNVHKALTPPRRNFFRSFFYFVSAALPQKTVVKQPISLAAASAGPNVIPLLKKLLDTPSYLRPDAPQWNVPALGINASSSTSLGAAAWEPMLSVTATAQRTRAETAASTSPLVADGLPLLVRSPLLGSPQQLTAALEKATGSLREFLDTYKDWLETTVSFSSFYVGLLLDKWAIAVDSAAGHYAYDPKRAFQEACDTVIVFGKIYAEMRPLLSECYVALAGLFPVTSFGLETSVYALASWLAPQLLPFNRLDEDTKSIFENISLEGAYFLCQEDHKATNDPSIQTIMMIAAWEFAISQVRENHYERAREAFESACDVSVLERGLHPSIAQLLQKCHQHFLRIFPLHTFGITSAVHPFSVLLAKPGFASPFAIKRIVAEPSASSIRPSFSDSLPILSITSAPLLSQAAAEVAPSTPMAEQFDLMMGDTSSSLLDSPLGSTFTSSLRQPAYRDTFVWTPIPVNSPFPQVSTPCASILSVPEASSLFTRPQPLTLSSPSAEISSSTNLHSPTMPPQVWRSPSAASATASPLARQIAAIRLSQASPPSARATAPAFASPSSTNSASPAWGGAAASSREGPKPPHFTPMSSPPMASSLPVRMQTPPPPAAPIPVVAPRIEIRWPSAELGNKKNNYITVTQQVNCSQEFLYSTLNLVDSYADFLGGCNDSEELSRTHTAQGIERVYQITLSVPVVGDCTLKMSYIAVNEETLIFKMLEGPLAICEGRGKFIRQGPAQCSLTLEMYFLSKGGIKGFAITKAIKLAKNKLLTPFIERALEQTGSMKRG
jgi:ribosome-associated toxin RatA of RatAB toxin-antitoxin module